MSFMSIVQIVLLVTLSLREAEPKHNVKHHANNLMNPEVPTDVPEPATHFPQFAQFQRIKENSPWGIKHKDAIAHGRHAPPRAMVDRMSNYSQQKGTANASRVVSTMQDRQQCENGYGGINIQVMNQWIQIMTQDTDKMYYFFNTIQETERQFDVEMDDYVGKLAGLDEKLNQMTSQIQWESSASRQILQFTETTKREVDELQKIKEKEGYVFGRINSPNGTNIKDGTFEHLEQYLHEMLTLITQTRQHLHSASTNLNQSITSLAQMVITLHDARPSTTFETASNRITSSVGNQVYSIQEHLDTLNANLGNISHFGYNLRGGTDSIMNIEQLMNSINKIAVKLLKKAREGCSEAKLLGGFEFNFRTRKKNTHQEKYGRDEEEYSHAQQPVVPSWTTGGELAEVNEGKYGGPAGFEAQRRSYKPHQELEYGQNGETKLEPLHQNSELKATGPSTSGQTGVRATGVGVEAFGAADGSNAHHGSNNAYGELGDGQNEEITLEHSHQSGEQQTVGPSWEAGERAAEVGRGAFGKAVSSTPYQKSHKSYETHRNKLNGGRVVHLHGTQQAVARPLTERGAPRDELKYGKNEELELKHFHQNSLQQAVQPPGTTGGRMAGVGGAAAGSNEHHKRHESYDQNVSKQNEGGKVNNGHHGAH